MSSISRSNLFASAFDNKKLFIIMVVLAVTLFVDTEIGSISDMIPKQILPCTIVIVVIGSSRIQYWPLVLFLLLIFDIVQSAIYCCSV